MIKGSSGFRNLKKQWVTMAQITARHNFSTCPIDFGAGDNTQHFHALKEAAFFMQKFNLGCIVNTMFCVFSTGEWFFERQSFLGFCISDTLEFLLNMYYFVIGKKIVDM